MAAILEMPQYVAYQKNVIYAFIKLSAKSHSFNILRTMDGLSCPTIMSIDKMGVWLKFWGSPSYAKDSFIAVLKEAIWKRNTIFLNFCRKCVNKVFVLQISGVRGIFSTKYTTFLAYFFKLVEFTFRHVNFKIIFSVQFARREFEDKDPLIGQ